MAEKTELAVKPEVPGKSEVAYPPVLQAAEEELLKKRAVAALGESRPGRDLTGVALSGGGIRSATFALGFFQGLARKRKSGQPGLLRHIDFISSVSGGGYFGSFLGRLFTRDYVRTPEDVENVLLEEKKPEVLKFLRENGKYMSPNGGDDALLLGAILFRNWVSIHFVLVIFLLSLFFALQVGRAGLEAAVGYNLAFWPQEEALLWWSPILWLPVATFVFCAIPLGWAYWLIEPRKGKDAASVGERSAIPPLVALGLFLVICSAVATQVESRDALILWHLGALIAILTIFVWAWVNRDRIAGEDDGDPLARDAWQRKLLALWITRWLVITALLTIVALIDTFGQSAYVVLTSSEFSIGRWLTGIIGSLGLAGLGRYLAIFSSKGPQSGRPSIPLKILATVVSILLAAVILVALNCVSHMVAWGGEQAALAPRILIEKAPAGGEVAENNSAEKDPYQKRRSELERAETKRKEEMLLACCPGASLHSPSATNEPKPAEPDRSAKIKTRAQKVVDQAHLQAARGPERRDLLGLAAAFFGTLLLSVLFGQTWPFVNRSSHLQTYASRLTRAYLGASNSERHPNKASVTEPVAGDDIQLADYWKESNGRAGAPLHLINVTINETVEAVSQIQRQDRKGLALALGPCGWSAGVRHHLVLSDPAKLQVFPQLSDEYSLFPYPNGAPPASFAGEALSLGTWLGISGAAFSTGTGMRTSLGMSFLAGLANIRLGRWWDSGVQARTWKEDHRVKRRKFVLRLEDALARMFPVQVHLLDEFFARFPGTARRHWYLSDGGHFENMGGYELIRRRLRFIVVIDAEQDADYRFEGLANLVRKARLDFGAEIRFLTERELAQAVKGEAHNFIGTLDQLKRGVWEEAQADQGEGPRKTRCRGRSGTLKSEARGGVSLVYAALAQVSYDSEPKRPSWLLYVKPALTGCEPSDLAEYHGSHPDFPHESTIDQYFDEAQWESYRRLGDHIASRLFDQVQRLVPEGKLSTLIDDWSLEFPSESCEEIVGESPD